MVSCDRCENDYNANDFCGHLNLRKFTNRKEVVIAALLVSLFKNQLYAALFFGFLFFLLYIGWVVYRVFIKKDLKQHKNDFYALTFFIAVWLLLYFWFFFKEIMFFIKKL